MRALRAMNTGLDTGRVNMAIDEALLRGVEGGSSPQTVRVFGWRPPAVSIGHSQDAGRELDMEACRRLGFDVVRRPTGGRAVLHSGELTYSVVGRSGDDGLGRTVMETYRRIADALVRGLRSMGVDAGLEETASVTRPRGAVATPPCFASAGRYEIVVSGRKLVGSAQRRLGSAVLQHGSLLVDPSHAEIVEVLRVPEGSRERMRGRLLKRTTDLASLLGSAPDFEDIASAIFRGFELEWGVELIHKGPTAVESESALRLATEYAVVG